VKIFSLLTPQNEPFIGLEYEGVLYNFTRAWEIFKDLKTNGRGPNFSFLQLMIEMDYFSRQTFEEIMTTIGGVFPLTDLEETGEFNYAIPIGRPQKVICLGRNYAEHAKESGAAPPEEPIIFAKAPTTLIPHQGTIVLPQGIGRVDHEAELAVVIGKQGRFISEAQANDFIAGYTIMNDVTARDVQKADIKASKPWFLSKSLDTFGPIGPALIPREAVADPHNLDITLKLNNKVKQQANTREMIFNIPQILTFISRFMTLNSGDIISTGTPAGISPLADGDIIEIEISEIGLLRNFVIEASTP